MGGSGCIIGRSNIGDDSSGYDSSVFLWQLSQIHRYAHSRVTGSVGSWKGEPHHLSNH